MKMNMFQMGFSKQGGEISAERANASLAALGLIKDGMIIGLGSGSTVKLFIRLLAEKVKKEDIELYIVSSSFDTSLFAASLGLVEVPLYQFTPDLSVDGADVVFPDKSLIKGGGGCLLREKLVDYYAREYVIIVDHGKLRPSFEGELSIPVEVHPLAYKHVEKEISRIYGARVGMRLLSEKKVGPVITDNGGFLIDVVLEWGEDLGILEEKMKTIPGVLETGIFSVKKPSKIFVGYPEGVRVLA
jgi:ribose 5-phosphate isomerase A